MQVVPTLESMSPGMRRRRLFTNAMNPGCLFSLGYIYTPQQLLDSQLSEQLICIRNRSVIPQPFRFGTPCNKLPPSFRIAP